MHVLARVRSLMARQPWIYWALVAVAAMGVVVGAARAIGRVDAARRSWGDQQPVWVATTAIEPGEPITATRRDLPMAVVPAVAAVEDPSGTVARQRVGAGEIITDGDLAARGAVSLVPEGWVAFAAPAVAEHFRIGDHVRVFAGDQSLGDGLVIDSGDSDLMVAIPADAAPAMAAALLTDSVTIALSPDP